MARIVGIDADAKNDLCSVTLQVADKKGGPSQILKCPITKLPSQKNKPCLNRVKSRFCNF